MCKIFTFSFAKKSIPYSQALRIKRFCSTFDEYKKHSNDLAKQIVGKEYKENIIRNQMEEVDSLERFNSVKQN